MGGTLKIVPQGSLKSLDPQWTTLIVTAHVKRHMQEALFHPDANFSLQPFLVKDFSTSADGLTWTFGLREGLKFHDGTAVTAADVVGSFNRVAEKAIVWKLVRSDFGAVMSAVDDQTIQVLLERPTGLVIDGLNIEQSFSPVIVPQAIYSLPQSETAETSIGTGPFKFVEWLPGDRLIHLHLHDWVDQDHFSPLDGAIQWDEIFTAFRDIDYKGWFMFEAAYPPGQRGEVDPNYVLDKVGAFPRGFIERYGRRARKAI